MTAGEPMNAKKQVLVLGGGIAGITAALELSRCGVETILVEKGPFLGGYAAQFACKATDRCLRCNNCLVEQNMRDLTGADGVETLLLTGLKGVERRDGGFTVTLEHSPRYIDAEKCTNCGVCYDKCPDSATGAILRSPSRHNHPFYAVNPEACHYFTDRKARMCQEACPENAIDLSRTGSESRRDVDGIIVATGYAPFDPRRKERFNFAAYPNMITGLDLERMLRENGTIKRPSGDEPLRSVAFVQCVGSRDASLGNNFCSRVCCGYGLRMAMRIKHEQPDVSVSVFYMDIQNLGPDFDRYMKESGGSLELVRSMPGDYYAAPDDRIKVRYFETEQRTVIEREFDMVVLSVGITPDAANAGLGQMLQLNTDEFGFYQCGEDDDNAGVFTAGTVEGPRDIAESIAHASRAAEQMVRHLRQTV